MRLHAGTECVAARLAGIDAPTEVRDRGAIRAVGEPPEWRCRRGAVVDRRLGRGAPPCAADGTAVVGNRDEETEIAGHPDRSVEDPMEGIALQPRGLVRVGEDLAVRIAHGGGVVERRHLVVGGRLDVLAVEHVVLAAAASLVVIGVRDERRPRAGEALAIEIRAAEGLGGARIGVHRVARLHGLGRPARLAAADVGRGVLHAVEPQVGRCRHGEHGRRDFGLAADDVHAIGVALDPQGRDDDGHFFLGFHGRHARQQHRRQQEPHGCLH